MPPDDPCREARAPGRPKSERCRLAVLEAAAEMLVSVPYSQVTIEGIAERAGVSKQTIYNRWKSRAALCVEAYAERTRGRFVEPPAGPLRERLTFILTQTARALRADNNASIIAGLIGEAQADPELAVELRDVFFAVRRRPAIEALESGVAAGELRADLDVPLTIDLLYGPLWHRLLLRHAPLDDAFAEQVIANVWPAIAAAQGRTNTIGASASP
jgi:AcrR family transcriptional regulator